VPDVPTNLQDKESDGEKIIFTWDPVISDGGTEVLEYTVFYDISGVDRYRVLSDVAGTEFSSDGLFPLRGLNQISFKVAAKNKIGLSKQSKPIYYYRYVADIETGEERFKVNTDLTEQDQLELAVDGDKTADTTADEPSFKLLIIIAVAGTLVTVPALVTAYICYRRSQK